ncbi:MAG: single-stranded DNA-binding protein [Patescibacteria group bacterium UBA2163]
MYLNKAFIAGNLTRDPELRALPSGANVATFGVATNRVWYNQDRQKQEATEFHNIVVFGRQAETTAQYLKKGSGVLIEGRIQTRSWDKDGQKQYRTEIVADRVQFGARSGTGDTQETRGGDQPGQEGSSDTNDIEYPTEEISPDDIPF